MHLRQEVFGASWFWKWRQRLEDWTRGQQRRVRLVEQRRKLVGPIVLQLRSSVRGARRAQRAARRQRGAVRVCVPVRRRLPGVVDVQRRAVRAAFCLPAGSVHKRLLSGGGMRVELRLPDGELCARPSAPPYNFMSDACSRSISVPRAPAPGARVATRIAPAPEARCASREAAWRARRTASALRARCAPRGSADSAPRALNVDRAPSAPGRTRSTIARARSAVTALPAKPALRASVRPRAPRTPTAAAARHALRGSVHSCTSNAECGSGPSTTCQSGSASARRRGTVRPDLAASTAPAACAGRTQIVGDEADKAGVCSPCSTYTDCNPISPFSIGGSMAAGAWPCLRERRLGPGACTTNSQCGGGEACVQGTWRHVHRQCPVRFADNLQRRGPKRRRPMLVDDRAMHERLLHVRDQPAVRAGAALRRRRLRFNVNPERDGVRN